MFGLNHDIPSPAEMHISKLEGGVINTDTCNAARRISLLLSESVEKAVKEKFVNNGGSSDMKPVTVLTQDCHHHMRNVWIGAVTKRLSTYLNEILTCDLNAIDFRYRVSTMFDAVLRAVDKEFSLPANYPKGHGSMFLHWLKSNHPGACWFLLRGHQGLDRTWPLKEQLPCIGIGGKPCSDNTDLEYDRSLTILFSDIMLNF
jgi:hypothetical protein